MPTQAVSFSEVLEDELRYFFAEKVEFDAITFERKHIREIQELALRLEVLKQQGPSRWRILADRVEKSPKYPHDREGAVLDGLQAMLGDDDLLRKLLETGNRVAKEIASSQKG